MIKFFTKLGCVEFFCLTSFAAHAQVYGTDYLTFQGTAVVLDNPTSAACQAVGINYDLQLRVSYRYTANPSVISDTLVFIAYGQRNPGTAQMYSTQSPNFSLSGPSTIGWNYINSYGNFGSGLTSTSNLTILSGVNTPVTLGTGNIKILGSIGDFLSNSGCNINQIHAALVAIPQ